MELGTSLMSQTRDFAAVRLPTDRAKQGKKMQTTGSRTAAFLIACVFPAWGAPVRDAGRTNPTLFEVRQQCNEIAAFFPVPLSRARQWVPPAYNLAVDAQGNAVGALVFMNCPNCYLLATPNSSPLQRGVNIAPGSVVHLWFMLQGPAQVLKVPGAQETASTQYAYAVADLVTSAIAARVYRHAGKNAVLLSSATLVDQGKDQTGEIKFTNGSKITFEAHTPTQLPTPFRLGGNIWNWHVGSSAEMDDNLRDSSNPVGGHTRNVNTTRVMFLATVPGPPNTTRVTIHADPGTAFAHYFGTNDVVTSRATFFRPNNIVNNSSRGRLAWRSHPPYSLDCPASVRSSQP